MTAFLSSSLYALIFSEMNHVILVTDTPKSQIKASGTTEARR